MFSASKKANNNFGRLLISYADGNDNAQKRLSSMCGVAIPKADSLKSVKHIADVLSLLDQFSDCAGYSTNRRGKSILDLSSEAQVQDLLYFMLRPSIPDLVSEQPIAGKTRQYSIQDFRSPNLRLVIEAKRVREKTHGKSIKGELHDDIGEYKNDVLCDDLIFFIYDPQTFIESPTGLIKSVEGTHSHNGRSLTVHCLVKR